MQKGAPGSVHVLVRDAVLHGISLHLRPGRALRPKERRARWLPLPARVLLRRSDHKQEREARVGERRALVLTNVLVTRKSERAVIFFGWVFFLVSSAHPHVLRAHTGRTVRADERTKSNSLTPHWGEVERPARRRTGSTGSFASQTWRCKTKTKTKRGAEDDGAAWRQRHVRGHTSERSARAVRFHPQWGSNRFRLAPRT